MRLLLILTIVTFSLPTHAAPLHILLTNDDGIDAPGIKAVEKALVTAGHKVTVVAPAAQQSGASSSITGGDIEVIKRDDLHWAVAAKPLNAALIGLRNILAANPPDLVISGANLGQNVGADTIISGTVGAALAAHRTGFPSIAISVEINRKEANDKPRFKSTLRAMQDAGSFLADLLSKPGIIELAGQAVININYPAKKLESIKGIRLASLSGQSLTSEPYKRISETKLAFQLPIFQSGPPMRDAELLANGYITVTFLRSNLEVTPEMGAILSGKFELIGL